MGGERPTASGRGRPGAWLALLALGAALAGCGEYSLDFTRRGPTAAAAKRRPELWTMIDIRRAQKAGRPIAPTPSFPDGLPDLFLKQGEDPETAVLKINPAFSEGDAAAFVVPEIWLNYDVMWVQPWYFLISTWNERSPQQNRLKNPDTGMNVPPVWDVGPRSLFYSPLWIVFYALVPPGTPHDRYTSAERIFDDNLTIYPGPPIIYSVRPPDVGLEMKMVHPYMPNKEVGGLSAVAESWVDGENIPYFVEGGNNWRYDPKTLEAEEVPLYFLARRDGGGNMSLFDTPPIMGSGPYFGRRPVDLANGRPRFGGYSRFYFAIVTSATAEAFDPDVHVEAAALLLSKGGDPRAFKGRVALNGKKVAETDRACFAQADFPAGCNWLDSQAKVEDAVGVANIVRTEVTACSPLVFYGGKGIGR